MISVSEQIDALVEATRQGYLTGLECLAGLEDLETLFPDTFPLILWQKIRARHQQTKCLLIGGRLA